MKRSNSGELSEESKKVKTEGSGPPYYIYIESGLRTEEFLVTRELDDFERKALEAADGQFNGHEETDLVLRVAEALFHQSTSPMDQIKDLSEHGRELLNGYERRDYDFSRKCPPSKRGTLSEFRIELKTSKRQKIDQKCTVIRFCMDA